MKNGNVHSIHIAPEEGGATRSVDSVRAVAGAGLEGDRYYDPDGSASSKRDPGWEATLIELEAIDAVRRDYGVEMGVGDSRRNIVTQGVALNHLVGREFRVGEVRMRGIRLCEPCGYLAGLTHEKVRKGLVHRGGLRAQILEGGRIRVGDSVEPV